eukprot:10739945-Karenia_brevis.AAC.1
MLDPVPQPGHQYNPTAPDAPYYCSKSKFVWGPMDQIGKCFVPSPSKALVDPSSNLYAALPSYGDHALLAP